MSNNNCWNYTTTFRLITPLHVKGKFYLLIVDQSVNIKRNLINV